jgi:hypothetical protein
MRNTTNCDKKEKKKETLQNKMQNRSRAMNCKDHCIKHERTISEDLKFEHKIELLSRFFKSVILYSAEGCLSFFTVK